MDFLLKLKAGIKTGKSISSGKIFDTWSLELKSEEDVKEFAGELVDNAKTIKQISFNAVGQSGGYSDWNYFTGLRRVVQHFEVLLAGANFSDSSYAVLNRLVQDRMVLALLSKSEKEFERLVHPWAKAIRNIGTNPSRSEIYAATKEAQALDGLEELFETAFIKIQSLRYTTHTHQEILRYLLARSSKILQDRIDSIELPLREYMQTTSTKNDSKRGFDLDHIFPKNKAHFADFWTKPEDWSEFDDEKKNEYESKYIHSLGNLALLHPRDDRNQSDALPWSDEKKSNYENSEIYLNRLFVDTDASRLKTEHKSEIDSLQLFEIPTFNTWSAAGVDKRAKAIWELIRNDMLQSFNE
jgi:hypothetical protein